MDELILRLLWVLILVGGGLALYAAANRLLILRARPQAAQFARAGKPVLLYFTSPTCAPCKTVQRPAIERLQIQMGEAIEVVEIDASVDEEIANRWGVLSVPTTFVLDAAGQPRFVNHGVAPAEKLAKQLRTIVE